MTRIKHISCLLVIQLCIWLAACGEDKGRPSALPSLDGGTDASDEMDAAMDSDVDLDASDAGDAEDGDPEGDAEIPYCEMDGAPSSCDLFTDEPCAETEECIFGGCNGGYCAQGGASCEASTDCPDGATCEPPDGGASICRQIDPEAPCEDGRTCPEFHKCEAAHSFPNLNQCVDRRVPCSGFGTCPSGYSCERPGGSADFFCVRTLVPCEDDPSICTATGLACVDIFNDGSAFCYPPIPPGSPGGSCDSLADCPDADAPTCDVLEGVPTCGVSGPCLNDDDCADDPNVPDAGNHQLCVDVHKDTFKHCLWQIGDCQSDSDCSERELCVNTATRETTCASLF